MNYENLDERRRFAVAMNWLGEKFPYKGEAVKLSKEDLKDYFDALSNFHIYKVEWAAKEYFKVGLHFPKPKQLIELATSAPSLPVEKPKQIEHTTPPGEAKKRLQAIFDELNKEYGTELTA